MGFDGQKRKKKKLLYFSSLFSISFNFFGIFLCFFLFVLNFLVQNIRIEQKMTEKMNWKNVKEKKNTAGIFTRRVSSACRSHLNRLILLFKSSETLVNVNKVWSVDVDDHRPSSCFSFSDTRNTPERGDSRLCRFVSPFCFDGETKGLQLAGRLLIRDAREDLRVETPERKKLDEAETFCVKSINQSVEQSINQSINQSVDRSINRAMNQWINQLSEETVNQSKTQSIN